tara:strand:- start:11798 stop:12049 length:252 start_codon:yes stop_codon:yes gene_type:complete
VLVACRAAELIGLQVEQGVEGVLHALAHHLIEVAANLAFVDFNDFARDPGFSFGFWFGCHFGSVSSEHQKVNVRKKSYVIQCR